MLKTAPKAKAEETAEKGEKGEKAPEVPKNRPTLGKKKIVCILN
jgi:hypothetical protein